MFPKCYSDKNEWICKNSTKDIIYFYDEWVIREDFTQFWCIALHADTGDRWISPRLNILAVYWILNHREGTGGRRVESEYASLISEFVVILFFTIVHNRNICVAEKQLRHTHSGSRNLPIWPRWGQTLWRNYPHDFEVLLGKSSCSRHSLVHGVRWTQKEWSTDATQLVGKRCLFIVYCFLRDPQRVF